MCAAVTAGNPLLLTLLAGSVARAGLEPTKQSLTQVERLGSEAFQRQIGHRLDRMDTGSSAHRGGVGGPRGRRTDRSCRRRCRRGPDHHGRGSVGARGVGARRGVSRADRLPRLPAPGSSSSGPGLDAGTNTATTAAAVRRPARPPPDRGRTGSGARARHLPRRRPASTAPADPGRRRGGTTRRTSLRAQLSDPVPHRGASTRGTPHPSSNAPASWPCRPTSTSRPPCFRKPSRHHPAARTPSCGPTSEWRTDTYATQTRPSQRSSTPCTYCRTTSTTGAGSGRRPCSSAHSSRPGDVIWPRV